MIRSYYQPKVDSREMETLLWDFRALGYHKEARIMMEIPGELEEQQEPPPASETEIGRKRKIYAYLGYICVYTPWTLPSVYLLVSYNWASLL